MNINDENGYYREGYRGSSSDKFRLFLGTPFMGSKANDITIKNIRIIDNPYIKFIGVYVFETEYSSPDYLLFDLKDLRRIDFSKGETLENDLKHGLCMVLDITEENYEIYNKGDAYKYIVNFEFEIESNGSTFYIQREREIGITDLKREYTAKYSEIN